MRRIPLLLSLLVPVVARADTSSSQAGSCTGQLQGSYVGIAVNRPSGTVSINSTVLASVFGNAECLCDDPDTEQNDLMVEIQVMTPLPLDSNGASLEIWVGNGCDNYQTRSQTTQTTCQKLTTKLTSQNFITGVATSTSLIRIPISASALTTPKVMACSGASVSRTFYLFIFRDPAMPLAQCTINTNVNNTGPAGAMGAMASSGDEAATISWTPPASTELQPQYYQILCADANGQPVPGKKPSDQSYSTCLPNGSYQPRTTLPIGGATTSPGTGTDGGTSIPVDMSIGTAGFHPPPRPHFEPKGIGDDGGITDDAGTDDAGTDDAGTDDGGTTTSPDLLPPATGFRGVTTTSLPAPFTNLDPAYLCSKPIPSGATTFSERISGLTNHQAYNFVVLAVDAWGNVTPSGVLAVTPQPVEDFYRRYRSEGGTASGFCFIATAAFGSYENRWVHVLREFRDEILLPTETGAEFVAWYYDHSPPLAGYIAEHKAARVLTRMLLWPVIGAAAFVLYVPAPIALVLFGGLVGLLFRRRIEAWWVRG